ncbi:MULTISPECIES: acyl-CoA dehydrogenase family protein [Actinomadura]|uniref:Acyl-CoA dehydrogenase family protein n=2 Tax=Actinomadura yumaensis TaxID=111807 RepID=A0ABW2CWV4_9ACTN|nr:acyl-CoA dehydrogenase family protein [Actinomadura sp. J1-007]MWK32727.1 acyl-CoA dehydrogenase [Actinomadura sp. J1-007]
MGLLEETARDILSGPDPWPALEEAGLASVGVPEDAGGSGGTLADAAVLLRASGRHGASVPLAETGWLAGRLLAAAGLPVPRGPLTAAAGNGAFEAVRDGDGWVLTGTLRRVPWARSAHRVAVVADGRQVVVADPALATITPGENVAGEPRDEVTFDGVRAERAAPSPVDAAGLRRWGALARAVQLTGAMRGALDLAVRYAGEREQFGRPIGRFQAVQQMLAELAGEAAVADVAVRAAVRAPDDEVAVAAAKANASRAAGRAAAIAHQVHGAIGVTQEHGLRRFTLRLWSWREEYGDETTWADVLGGRPGDPWATLTGR